MSQHEFDARRVGGVSIVPLEQFDPDSDWNREREAAVARRPKRKQPEAATPGDDAFVPASALWEERFDHYKTFSKWLKRNEESIRNHKPSQQRLLIHAGDWHWYWIEYDRLRFSRLDEREIESEIAKIRERKSRRK